MSEQQDCKANEDETDRGGVCRWNGLGGVNSPSGTGDLEDPVLKRGLLRKTNRMGGRTIDRILAAAGEILSTEGTGKLTMARVAAAAGVTKGTLLYHFHDKNQLLEALMEGYVEHLAQCFEDGIGRVRAKGWNNLTRERETIAGFIEWYRSFRQRRASYTAFGLSILSISAENEKLRMSAYAWYESVFGRLRLSGDTRVVEAALTLEGLFFLRHFHLDVTKDDEVEEILARMEKTLIEGEG